MTDTFAPAGKADNIIPRFYVKAVKNEFRSEAEGREVYNDVEYVEMIVPGDKNSIVDERVKDVHRERWARQYAAFKESREAPVEGTPLEEWAAVTVSQVMELKSSHVRTVEQLAGLSDSQLSKVVPMGGHALREKAQLYVSQESKAEARVAELEKLVADLMAGRQTVEPEQKDEAA